MAQFRGTISGSRGEASRLGGKSSGMKATVNGWNSGVTVRAFVDELGRDCFALYATGGSDQTGRSEYIGFVTAGHFIAASDRNRGDL